MDLVKKQLEDAPINSMYLCENLEMGLEIAEQKYKLNRLDVDIITLNWLNDHWRNLSLFKHIVIDHRLELTPEQLDEIQYINFYLEMKSSRIQEFLD